MFHYNFPLLLNAPSPTNLMSPMTPLNYEGDNVKIVLSTLNTMQILGDNISPPYHHVHAQKSSSPIPVHLKMQTSIDMKCVSLKKMSSAH